MSFTLNGAGGVHQKSFTTWFCRIFKFPRAVTAVAGVNIYDQTCGTFGHHWWTVRSFLELLSCQVWFFTSKPLPLQSSTENKRARASIWHLPLLSVEWLWWTQVLSVKDVKQCLCWWLFLFLFTISVWKLPMPFCCKTSSMLSTSPIYTLFYGQTHWFEICSSSPDDRRSNMFIVFILLWRFTMATSLVLQEKRICLAGTKYCALLIWVESAWNIKV